MSRIILTILACLFSVGLAHAEIPSRVSTRYGDVVVVNSANIKDAFDISLSNKLLTTIKASDTQLNSVEDIEFSLIPSSGKNEYVLISKWSPGLHCHYEFVLLEINPDKKTIFSSSFGACMELAAVKSLDHGAEISLISPLISGERNSTETYLWAKGKITKVRIRK